MVFISGLDFTSKSGKYKEKEQKLFQVHSD